MQFVCHECGKAVPTSSLSPACSCGGLFDLDFNAPVWNPIRIDRSTWSIFRYREFLAIEGDAWKRVTMGEGMTPVIEYEPGVLFKMDYFMPTISFKDRGAATLVAHMVSAGVKTCVQDSSGNAGNAVAAYCARANIACEIFVPEGTSPKKIAMIEAHGAKVHVVAGTRDHCAEVCRKKVSEDGAYYANHVYNPFFYEGMKCYIYEVLEQLGRIPANIVIPVGNGTLFFGVVLALEHLQRSGAIDKFPQIIVVQGERCAPLAKAYAAGFDAPAKIHPEPTMAEGIAIGVPMRGRAILEMSRRHDVRYVCAPESKILETRAEIARHGIYCEHTTAANLAAFRRYVDIYGPAPDTLITMCGMGIKSDH